MTTAREVGGNFEKTKQWRAESAAHTIVAPRILLYPMLARPRAAGPGRIARRRTKSAQLVRSAKERGADGMKLIGPMDRDQAAAAIDEAKKVGLPTTVHIAVGEATARDFVDLGVNCIEHFYGVADASLDGIQDFPPELNLANEIHRFGRAGELYTQNNFNPAEALEAARRHGREGRRVEPDDVDLRGDARFDQGAEPAVVQGLPASVARGVLQAEHDASWHVLARLDDHAGSAAGGRTTRYGWRPCANSDCKGGVITTGDDSGFL